MNLSGGSVESVIYEDVTVEPDQDKSWIAKEAKAIVSYNFADGTKVEIPMYQTYQGIWLPREGNTCMTNMNADFKRYEKSDYKKAVKSKDFEISKFKSQQLCLLLSTPRIKIYGTYQNYIIVEDKNTLRPYDIPWLSVQGRIPEFEIMDYDNDGVKELAIVNHVGTGTGVSIDYLYMLDRRKDGKLASYEYSNNFKDMRSRFFYTYDKDTDEIQYYVSGAPITPKFKFQDEVGDPSAEFDSIGMGDFGYYQLKKGITFRVDLEGYQKNTPMPSFYKAGLTGIVKYYGDGQFWLEDVKLDGYDEKDKQRYNSGVKKIKLGESIEVDLNGDGVKEYVSFNQIESTEEGYYSVESELTIDDCIYGANILEGLGMWLVNGGSGYWYLADLDSTDSYKEILLYDVGPSDDPITYFIRYDNDLIYCGLVPDFPENDSFRVNSDGTVNSRKRLEILQTWWASSIWKLNQENQLEEVEQEWYQPDIYPQTEYTRNYLLKDVALYGEPKLDAKPIELLAGTVIYLPMTDNKNWVQVLTRDGQTGWFYLEDYTIQLPMQTYTPYEFMSYLCMAD